MSPRLVSVPSFCVETSRCKTLHAENTFDSIHIYKTGGSSWRKELNRSLGLRWGRPIYGAGASHDERSPVFYSSVNEFDFRFYHLISLRSPRHHVYSMFGHCKYVQVSKKPRIPRTGSTPESNIRDFRTWLNIYLNLNKTYPIKVDDSFDCYRPVNPQTNYLTSTNVDNVSPGSAADKNTSVEPNFELSRQVYETMDWVALTEFFHESKCLFYYRLEPKTEEVKEYLQDQCQCSNPHEERKLYVADISNSSDVHVVHHEKGHRSSLIDLPLDILNAINVLTQVDQKLYKEVALPQFLREVVWLEMQLDRRVLCNNVLERLEPELAYLNVSVSWLYRNEKDQMTL
jgi:hypothetical protein